jgi:hypothetical protein
MNVIGSNNMNKKILAAVLLIYFLAIGYIIYSNSHLVYVNNTDPEILEQLRNHLEPSDTKIAADNAKIILRTTKKIYEIGDTITVVFENISPVTFIGGWDAIYEINIDGEWYVVPNMAGWHQLGIMIYPWDVATVEMRTDNIGFDWIPGHYRIIKSVFAESSAKTVGSSIFYDYEYYAAEFYLKN